MAREARGLATAAVKFSNGVVVLFNYGPVRGGWVIVLPNRRFIHAAITG